MVDYGSGWEGVICDPRYGFGVSSALSGSYQSMSNAVVWDMFVVSRKIESSPVNEEVVSG